MKISKIGKNINGKQYVVCKKDIATFKKGETYLLLIYYGDPAGAISAGYKYMVTEFLNVVIIMNGSNETYFFGWKGKKNHYAKYHIIGYFQDHFYLTEKEERLKKLNKLKIKT